MVQGGIFVVVLLYTEIETDNFPIRMLEKIEHLDEESPVGTIQ